MNTPPFLIGAALLFWGWRTGFWMVGTVLAALFEGSRFVKFRWEFTEKEYTRIVDVCTLLAVGGVVYLRFSEDISRSGFVLFQWMPMILGLIVLAQAYGTRDKIPFRVFSWFMRMRKDKAGVEDPGGLNVSWIYFCVCVLGAGATNDRESHFFWPGLALCAWAVWSTRTRRYAAPVWAVCLALAAGGGWAGHFGWSKLQSALLPLFGEAFARFGAKQFDALHARTTMGELSDKKASGKIMLRVKSESGHMPQLLRQSSFDTFRDTIWVGSRREFRKMNPENDITTWTLVPDHATSGVVRVSGYLPRRRGLISLPQGTGQIRDLPVGEMQATGLGVIRAAQGPGVVSYLADFAPGKTFDDDPTDADLHVPDIEKPALDEIALKIRAGTDTNAANLVSAVERFFAQNFSYSLAHKPNTVKEGSVIGRFLKTTRTGHCEYFASATALLLRRLEIPARYAVGFSVQEIKGDTWIVRERHAHAWVLAWIGGAWQEIDTTPGTWVEAERNEASWFEPVSDFFSNLWFQFSYWRWLGQKGFISRIAPYLILPLVAILVWRIFFQKNRIRSKEARKEKFNWPGLDSEFYALEARLAAEGHERNAHETPEQWLLRLRKEGVEHPNLPALVALHYRYRFDPRGLENEDRKRLRELASR